MRVLKFSSWLMLVAVAAAHLHSTHCLADEVDLAAIAELHRSEARAYSIYLDAQRKKPLELSADPIFKWQNLEKQGGQLGAIYAWTSEGRPEVLGTVFSQPEQGMRIIIHEFHTLAEGPLTVDSPESVYHGWKPKNGLPLTPFTNVSAVPDTPARRLSQMRALAREFSGYTQSEAERIELRLAPQPLIRYQPTRKDVLDGAIFAFLSSAAGTDPEFMLLIEARRAVDNPKDWAWHFGIARFTERNLVVSKNDTVVYSSIANPKLQVQLEDGYKWCHTPDESYVIIHSRSVPELTKATSK